jgi:type IV pilus assembly protein PilW
VNRTQKGMTLVELMVAMLLGLVIIGGVISVLLANKRSYGANEGLSQIQEAARTAFELMARDIREAGGTGCDSARKMANVLNGSATDWWKSWQSIRGYDGGDADPAVASGTAVGTRVGSTDSLQLQGVDGDLVPVTSHDTVGATLRLYAPSTTFGVGDIMVVCDFDHSATFQATDYDAAAAPAIYLEHDSGGTAPGNCAKGLGFPTSCATTTGLSYPFAKNSQVGKLYAVDWYVGNNGRAVDNGRSLYRVRLGDGGALVTEEIVSGVVDMQISYGVRFTDNISDATTLGTTAAAWQPVNSVFITLTVRSSETAASTNPTVNQGRLQRTFTYLVNLRNRSL